MTPTLPDDGWADLARELGMDAQKTAEPAPPTEPEYTTPSLFGDDLDEEIPMEEGLVPFPESPVDEVERNEEGNEEGNDDGEGEGQTAEAEADPDAPKKKRRRRRRRKKRGNEIGEAPTSGDGGQEVEDSEDDGEEELEAEAEVAQPEPAENGNPWANWDVPSWSEIIGGLYRPGR